MTLRGVALALVVVLAAPASADRAVARQVEARPNILWITSEDNAPNLGVYDDRDAITPNLDALAGRGLRYRTVWSTAPVCAPARTALATGMYPASVGGEHMRSLVRLPDGLRLFPALLRQAGYYTSNNSKQDYNVLEAGDGRSAPSWRPRGGGGAQEVATVGVWDDSSQTAHWRNRRPGQPFFAVFNLEDTHESRIHKKPAPKQHDPATVRLPGYLPDLPEIRADWAAYHDNMTVMDGRAGRLLAELEAAGLADDTIVFYFGDNGPAMPRGKRFVYDSGLRVPLIVHVPSAYRGLAPAGYVEGAISDRLVGFVDLGPTVLSLAGIRPPPHMQGRALMGPNAAPAPDYVYGERARMDERYDLSRAVRDRRHVYIRHYLPHRPYGQYLSYSALMPGWTAWRGLFLAGQLRPPHTRYWEPKPTEELYDLEADRDETTNLADSPAHRPVLDRLRAALVSHALAIRDLGFLPEYELHRVPVPFTFGQDRAAYDFEAIHAAAERASDRSVPLEAILGSLASPNAAVRYWTAVGATVRGRVAVSDAEPALLRLLTDEAPGPRIAAAEALARYGGAGARTRALTTLLALADATAHEEYVALLALNALVQVSDLSNETRARVAALPTAAPSSYQRGNGIQPLIEQITKGLH